ncbi:3-phosphoshikimate 1-carboxyvinyltransferase [Sphingosinicella humi]|uniref:3-phosphoshikimate 1-carboxyvinyltransferase n=1 Tax=Allosphingosinicella humi TaxID=2068657 RepID=A0A2U2J5Z1_9SPHN|nr:3-phosphoshikimate 1-carboxyvinyltransferase [Sphingosinicella humi]PWG03750.1 3-phosphoshikimate 1-carboxyvinyltransferase [Sphingosinicella humi]
MKQSERGDAAQPATFGPGGPLKGRAAVPGDKSISHRALMFAAMAAGRSRIEGLSEGGDVRATAEALGAMGVGIARRLGGWDVDGVGAGALLQPARALDMGNSGTSTRLLMGLVATHPIAATFIGDESLCRRPMDRVIAPLSRLGADVAASAGGRLPLTLRGLSGAVATEFRLAVASAQVKSALLLAGLNASGTTRVIEPVPTRDHTERMLKAFGADIETGAMEDGERLVSLKGEAELTPRIVAVPADPSSAAFLIVAALIVPGSEIRLDGVGVNPTRIGLFETLRAMGADLTFENPRDLGGEPVADIIVRHSPLEAVDVPPEVVPAMIDEFPIFFVAAAFARGESRARGLAELRVKESDRIAAMARGLRAIGAKVEEAEDGLAIEGSGGDPLPGGATVASELDHRIAMSFAVAGLHCRQPLTVDDMTPVETSFPGFTATLRALAAA